MYVQLATHASPIRPLVTTLWYTIHSTVPKLCTITYNWVSCVHVYIRNIVGLTTYKSCRHISIDLIERYGRVTSVIVIIYSTGSVSYQINYIPGAGIFFLLYIINLYNFIYRINFNSFLILVWHTHNSSITYQFNCI